MKKNDTIQAEITSVGANGQGVCRHDGMVVFVPCALAGETHTIRIIKVYPSYAVGKSIERISDAPARIPSVCTAFPRCGGCVWQHVTYEEELRIKTEQVKENIRRIGGLEQLAVLPAIPSPATEAWRNKILLPIGKDNEGHLIAGYYAGHSHTIVSADGCTQQPIIIRSITQYLLTLFESEHFSVYDENSGQGLLRTLCFRINNEGRILLCIIINGTKLKDEKTEMRVLSAVLDQFSAITTFAINENRERTNTVVGKHTRILWEEAPFTQTLFGISYPVSVSSFFQVNSFQTETLYKTAFSLLPDTAPLSVLDLYCGTGSIGLSLLATSPEKVKDLTGVEIVPAAVKNATAAATAAGYTNTSFFAGDAAAYFASAEKMPDLCIVDPPRKGCDHKLLSNLCAKKIPYILYISCDSATLARDLKFLIDAGYTASPIHTVDMFPRTSHVECCVLLCRKTDRRSYL